MVTDINFGEVGARKAKGRERINRVHLKFA